MSKDQYSDLVTEYCKKWPNLPHQTLAKLIKKENPEILVTVEQLRTRVRTRFGAMGDKGGTFKDMHKDRRDIRDVMKAFKSSLTSEKEGIDPFVIPQNIKSTWLFSDVHLPYHDEDALWSMIDYVQEQEIDSIIINGDLIDFYKISRYAKDPTRKGMKYEMDMAREFLEMIRYMYPDAHIYFKVGNHEDRYETYLKTNAPEFYGDSYYSMQDRLGLMGLNIHYIKSTQLIKYGKLNILHGHEWGNSFFSPVNPARGLFMRAKCSAIAGHNHQTSEHHEGNLNGEQIAAWSTGCLCQLNPEYRPYGYTKWNHGFAMLTKEKDGTFTVDNKRIIHKKGKYRVI